MNLAICHPIVIPARGGCETYIVDLLRRLDADGHEIHLYAAQWDAEALPSSLRVHPIREKTWPRILRPWRFSHECEKVTREGRHDLTLGFDKVGGVDVVYPQAGLYVATVLHSLARFQPGPGRVLATAVRLLDPTFWSFRQFERWHYLAPQPPYIIVNSHLVRQHFLIHLGIPNSQVAVLPSAIDPDRFAATNRPARRVETRQAWGVAPTDVVALFVAMNYRLKGLDPLLRAVACLPDRRQFRLAVVGDPKVSAYQRLARRLGIADVVRFLGFVADPRNAYFAADLLVHPTFYDPCSLVVREAQACGLPVITTRYNGAAELLDPPHDGIIIDDPHDREQLAGALECFLDGRRRQTAARAALKGGQRWTFDHHYRRLLELLQQALQRKRAA